MNTDHHREIGRLSSRRTAVARALCSLCASVLVCGSVGLAPPQADGLDGVLAAVVRDGRVDYRLLAEKHLPALDAYLSAANFDESAHLADLINLYNAGMLRAVVDHRIKNPAWKPSDESFGVFKEPRVRLGGKVVSLDHLENQVIRKRGDARIHAALNCAAVSCPPLIPRAYRADDLDAVLEANMKAFVNDPSRNRFDPSTRTLHLSSIFNWFAPDFGGPAGVPGYVSKYRPGDYAGWKVQFVEYDWNLNETK